MSDPSDAIADAERESHALRRLGLRLTSPGSYGMLLLLILVTYALSVALTQPWERSLVLVVQIGTVWLALRTSQARRAVLIIGAVTLAIAGLAAAANLIVPHEDASLKFVFLISTILYFLAPISIVRHLAFRRVVDQETMFGAICAYLLIGMFFAYAYHTIGLFQSIPFFGDQGVGTISQDMFFSFVTLTTTGYGNLVPAGNPGQSFAVAEALLGQLFLVTAVAKVVNAWTPRRLTTTGSPDGS